MLTETGTNTYTWTLPLSRPITQLSAGTLTVQVKDKQGNLTKIVRSFSVNTNHPGDLTGDGKVTLSDVRVMLQMLLGQVPVDLTTADLNHDGKVSLMDLRVLLQLL